MSGELLNYFIPTDEQLYRYEHTPIIDEDTCEIFQKVERLRLIGTETFKLYNNECNVDQPALVRQHYHFINLMLNKLKTNGYNKVECTRENINYSIKLFIGLGIDDKNYGYYEKYYEKSSVIFDWSKYFTQQAFDYRDKLDYYKFIRDKPTYRNGHVPTYYTEYNQESLEVEKFYLLKDIRGSGGGNIFPIIKRDDGSVYTMNYDNSFKEFNPRPDTVKSFFIQEFKMPITISGFDILKHLLGIGEELLVNKDWQDYYLLPSDIMTDDQFLTAYLSKSNTFSYLHKMLFTICAYKQYKSSDKTKKIINWLRYGINLALSDDFRRDFEERLRAVFESVIPGGFDNFIHFMRLIDTFLTKRHFMLKFRRPYLHIQNSSGSGEHTVARIIPSTKFDIDIIFEFGNDLQNLSIDHTRSMRDNFTSFKHFISNFTSSNSSILEQIITIIDPNNGIFKLEDVLFIPEQQTAIKQQERVILNDLKSGIQLKEDFQFSGKKFFKHYANDYIIDRDRHLFILEVNDNPIIQKNEEEFFNLMKTKCFPMSTNVGKKYLKKGDMSLAKEKYIKYKNKYQILKKKLSEHL